VGAEQAGDPTERGCGDRLLGKWLLREHLLQVFAGFGFTATSFTLLHLFVEAKPASESMCCKL